MIWNKLVAQVTGKRKREIGLVVPAKFSAFTTDLRLAKILETELRKRALKYTQFELKSIVYKKINFLGWLNIAFGFYYLFNDSDGVWIMRRICKIISATLIRGRRSNE